MASIFCRHPTIAMLSLMVAALLIATTVASMFLAISERKSRLQSQANRRIEEGLNRELSNALAQADRERERLLVANGLWQASNHNVGEALLWFSNAANMTEPVNISCDFKVGCEKPRFLSLR